MNDSFNKYQAIKKEIEESPEYKLYKILNDINEKICSKLEEQNMKKKDFASLLGKTKQYVNKLLNSHPNLTIKSLVKISQVLDLDLQVNLVENYVRATKKINGEILNLPKRNWMPDTDSYEEYGGVNISKKEGQISVAV